MAEIEREEIAPVPSWRLILLPIVLYGLHALLFRRWIVDDAGISFAYARSLGGGYGLVAQPGSPPVEAYSNFTWLALLAPFFSLGLFDPVLTPKLVSLALVAATFRVLSRPIWLLTRGSSATVVVVLSLIALNSPFTIWTTSGLENSLYALGISLLFGGSLKDFGREGDGRWRAAWLGLIAAFVAMTRPDGIVYFFAYPALLVWTRVWTPSTALRRESVVDRRAWSYLGAFALAFGLFLAFRLLYFNELLPNTYYSKALPRGTVRQWFEVETLTGNARGLVHCFLGFPGLRRLQVLLSALIVLAFAGATWWATVRDRLPEGTAVLAVFLAASTANYILMPIDWMGEHRFATPAVLFWYLFAGVVTHVCLAQLRGWDGRRLAIGRVQVGLLAGLLVYDVGIFAQRSIRFAERPTVPFDLVGQLYGDRYNHFAAALGVSDGSLLAPDMGGTLYYSTLRIYDLGMLCDRTIARTLGRNQPEFYRYVFETVKPTFIHTHTVWARLASFDDDARFRRDYVPLRESIDRAARGRYSGDYVRRDIVAAHSAAFEELRVEMGAIRRPE